MLLLRLLLLLVQQHAQPVCTLAVQEAILHALDDVHQIQITHHSASVRSPLLQLLLQLCSLLRSLLRLLLLLLCLLLLRRLLRLLLLQHGEQPNDSELLVLLLRNRCRCRLRRRHWHRYAGPMRMRAAHAPLLPKRLLQRHELRLLLLEGQRMSGPCVVVLHGRRTRRRARVDRVRRGLDWLRRVLRRLVQRVDGDGVGVGVEGLR